MKLDTITRIRNAVKTKAHKGDTVTVRAPNGMETKHTVFEVWQRKGVGRCYRCVTVAGYAGTFIATRDQIVAIEAGAAA